MVIKISDVQERWNISRPTVMKALKNGKLSGSRILAGVTGLEPVASG